MCILIFQMVGIGTGDTNLDAFRHTFCSLLGRDAESWGLSYTGQLHHRGEFRKYSQKFGQGSIIGIHLDMWLGRLMFYKNRKPLGMSTLGSSLLATFPLLNVELLHFKQIHQHLITKMHG